MLATGATAVAVAVFAGLLADQERRWRRSDSSVQSHFLPDGTPAMTVTGFGHGTAPGRSRAAVPAVTAADSGRTAQGKAAG